MKMMREDCNEEYSRLRSATVFLHPTCKFVPGLLTVEGKLKSCISTSMCQKMLKLALNGREGVCMQYVERRRVGGQIDERVLASITKWA